MIGIVAIYADHSDDWVALGHTRELAGEAYRGTAGSAENRCIAS
jgi:hypothetical protein